MKTKLLKNSYVLPMTLFCSALTFSPLGVAQAHNKCCTTGKDCERYSCR